MPLPLVGYELGFGHSVGCFLASSQQIRGLGDVRQLLEQAYKQLTGGSTLSSAQRKIILHFPFVSSVRVFRICYR